jgi:hypothetical protein
MTYEDRVPSTIPTPAELAAAPVIDRWQVIESGPWMHGQLWGYFRNHPEIADGTYAHSSPVIYLEATERPTWAVTRKRIYRLGDPMGAAEKRIREIAAGFGITAERVLLDDLVDKWGELSGESGEQADEVEQLAINLRRRELVDPDEMFELIGNYICEKYAAKQA